MIGKDEKRDIPNPYELMGGRIYGCSNPYGWRYHQLDERCPKHITGDGCPLCREFLFAISQDYAGCLNSSDNAFWIVHFDIQGYPEGFRGYYYDVKKHIVKFLHEMHQSNISELDFKKFRRKTHNAMLKDTCCSLL